MLSRVIVIDENLSSRIARELRNRGRNARAVEDLGLKGQPDPELIRRVFALYDDPVLVTGDDFMPAEHRTELQAVNATVATIRPWTPDEGSVDTWDGTARRSQSEWEEEIVQRWAHSMQAQARGTIRRYGLGSHGAWRPPRKRRSGKRGATSGAT